MGSSYGNAGETVAVLGRAVREGVSWLKLMIGLQLPDSRNRSLCWAGNSKLETKAVERDPEDASDFYYQNAAL